MCSPAGDSWFSFLLSPALGAGCATCFVKCHLEQLFSGSLGSSRAAGGEEERQTGVFPLPAAGPGRLLRMGSGLEQGSVKDPMKEWAV